MTTCMTTGIVLAAILAQGPGSPSDEAIRASYDLGWKAFKAGRYAESEAKFRASIDAARPLGAGA